MLGLTFSSFDDRSSIRFQTFQTPAGIEKNVKNVLAINPGGDGTAPSNSFIPNDPISGKGASDRGKDRFHDYDIKPRFPWGIGSSSGGNSGGSSSALSANALPEESEWDSDPKIWDEAQEDAGIHLPGKLSVDIDFPYKYDVNGNLTLLVPNIGRARTKRAYTKVDYDQTAAHVHHAPDLGIVLPQDFDMAKYEKLTRADRIEYAKQKLPRETIINYQNAIGKSMSPVFGVKTTSIPGFGGVRKYETELTLQSIKPNTNILGIIREDGTHISSFSITDAKLRRIAENDFWVLKDRNL